MVCDVTFDLRDAPVPASRLPVSFLALHGDAALPQFLEENVCGDVGERREEASPRGVPAQDHLRPDARREPDRAVHGKKPALQISQVDYLVEQPPPAAVLDSAHI